MTATSETDRVEVDGLRVATALKRFVDDEVLPGTGVSADELWSGFAALVHELAPSNRELLDTRTAMQQAIDRWHTEHASEPHDAAAYRRFLTELGYLVEAEGDEVIVTTENLDEEIASVPGPQLVVPVTNARYAINAANARWGSLYDALYGTDAMGELPPPGPYDAERGAQVIAWGRRFLDDTFPLADGSHADATGYAVDDGRLRVTTSTGVTSLSDPGRFVGHIGDPTEPGSLLLRNHGLVVELRIDRDHPVGSTDAAGVADIVLEAAVSVIMDCEDSVATVDADDKVAAYRNWLGLMRGDLTAEVPKGGEILTRRMSPDREYVTRDGGPGVLHGRGLMLVRNVGHLMDCDAVLDRSGRPVPEGLLDGLVTVACALHDLRGDGELRNSRTGSVYVVKPKMHGPDEVAFAVRLFDRVEDVLGLPRDTVKIGIMDEERRTSVNLEACIAAAASRVAFINTGFLDRTGDEIHTSMEAGAMVRKAEMKDQPWIRAYEDRNVDIGLACGLSGRAQIGKGMWAAPDRMQAMLEEKLGHPEAGATCAWVPSPTAATLHATHYHRVDVLRRQAELADRPRASLDDLLTIPVAAATDWSDEERLAELQNNAQGILGYVVRWIDQGVGCSKVPDIRGVALMEDRATCRISSQHIANWLRHGITTEEEVIDVMCRMAAIVDDQNAHDPGYTPMAPDCDGHAFRAALELVLEGTSQPSGYTEPILHRWRAERKRTLTVPQEPA